MTVWAEHQLAEFLGFVASDRLYGTWWLIALRGLRRGEAAWLRWVDVDLDGRAVTINQHRLAYGTTVAVGPPKTVASRRSVARERITVTVLRASGAVRTTSESPPTGTGRTPGTYSLPPTECRCIRTT